MGDDLHQKVRDAWDRTAEWWDEKVGPEGNDFHRILIGPSTERLLELKSGELVLDIACGNGQSARRMADLGARVVAIDFSEKFLERARVHSKDYQDGVEFRHVDATDREQLMALGYHRFDAAVCTMAIMDIASHEPLASVLPALLKPGGRFVFSVVHPSFNNSVGTKIVAEEAYHGTDPRPEFSIKVWSYIRPQVTQGIGIVGQPVPHYYFHRPLSLLLRPFFDAGLALDGLEEPTFPPQTAEPLGLLSWRNLPEIPPALVARLRVRG